MAESLELSDIQLSEFETSCSNEDIIKDDRIRSRSVWKKRRSDLYKTEMCRSFTELGFCKYADKCQFCHYPSELRIVTRHPKYKSVICRTFWLEGTCPYGKRCCFAHQEAEIHKKDDPLPNDDRTTRCSLIKETWKSAFGFENVLGVELSSRSGPARTLADSLVSVTYTNNNPEIESPKKHSKRREYLNLAPGTPYRAKILTNINNTIVKLNFFSDLAKEIREKEMSNTLWNIPHYSSQSARGVTIKKDNTTWDSYLYYVS